MRASRAVWVAWASLVLPLLGPPFVYLVFFGWSLGIMVLLVTVASFVRYADDHGMLGMVPRGPKVIAFGVFVVIAIGAHTASSATEAWGSSTAATEQRELSEIAPRVACALRDRGGDGPYLMGDIGLPTAAFLLPDERRRKRPRHP